MAELREFERSSLRKLAADILQYVISEHGMMWRWSGFGDVLLPRNLPHLYRMITFEIVKIGNSLDQLIEVVFDSDKSKVKATLLYSLLDATFMYRTWGRGFPQIIVSCSIIGQLSVFCCRMGRHFLVDELVDVMWRILSDRVGDNLPDLERFALANLVRMIPEAA